MQQYLHAHQQSDISYQTGNGPQPPTCCTSSSSKRSPSGQAHFQNQQQQCPLSQYPPTLTVMHSPYSSYALHACHALHASKRASPHKNKPLSKTSCISRSFEVFAHLSHCHPSRGGPAIGRSPAEFFSPVCKVTITPICAASRPKFHTKPGLKE